MLRVRNHNGINKYLEMRDRSRFIQTQISLVMSINDYRENKLLCFHIFVLFGICFSNDPPSGALKTLNLQTMSSTHSPPPISDYYTTTTRNQ